MKKLSIDKNLRVKAVANNEGHVVGEGMVCILLYLILCALIAVMDQRASVEFDHVFHKEIE
jgi:hypothetical protein